MSKWMIALTMLAAVSAQAGELIVRAEPGTSYVLPVNRPSCHQLKETKFAPYEVEANSFEIGSLALQWKGQNPMQVGSVSVEFKSPVLEAGQYQCVIEGHEVEALLSPFGHVMSPNKTHYSNGFCGIRCGSMRFISEVKSASLTGTLKVVGYELNEEGRFAPVEAVTPVTVEYRAW